MTKDEMKELLKKYEHALGVASAHECTDGDYESAYYELLKIATEALFDKVAL